MTNQEPTAHHDHPEHREGPFDEATYRELRGRASALLRGRRRASDPGTISLVNEVVLRFLQGEERKSLPTFESERDLLCYLTRAMRNHLISLSRKQLAARRPAEERRIPWPETEVFPATQHPPTHVLDIHLALEELARDNPGTAEIVEMMFFWGCTRAELAATLERTEDSIRGDWNFARAWLRRRLSKLNAPA